MNTTDPISPYRFTLTLHGPTGAPLTLGVFSEVAGISTPPPPTKIQGMNKSTDVTLKRGVVNAPGLSNWLSQVENSKSPLGRDLIITHRDPAHRPMQSWKLRNTKPKKYTGPALSGKGSDVAIEELVLSAERIEIASPH